MPKYRGRFTYLHGFLLPVFFVAGFFLIAEQGLAAGFDTLVSPPRFELSANSGNVVRQKLSISNSGERIARYKISTADWSITKSQGVKFHSEKPGQNSCRPWVRIERRKINVAGKMTRPFRFEVHVPKDPKIDECRFAILVSPDLGSMKKKEGITVVGQIAVIVYLTIGDAHPVLKLVSLKMMPVNGKDQPVAIVRNDGNAHGRLSGTLAASDAKGRKAELRIASFPILPGKSETLRLDPVDWSSGSEKEIKQQLLVPIKVKGTLGWDGGRMKINQTIK